MCEYNVSIHQTCFIVIIIISECCGLQICLQCGEKAHIGMTCVNYLKSTLEQQPSSEQTASIHWKINNT